MRSFEQLFTLARARHGDASAIEARLPQPKSADALAAIPDDRYLAGLSRFVFRVGLSWTLIEQKWDGFETAFEGFDILRWCRMSDDDVDRLLKDSRIIRHGAKIKAVGENAIMLHNLAKAHGSVGTAIAGWPADDFIGLVTYLKQHGSRLGGNTGTYFLRYMGRDGFILTDDVTAALVREGVIDKPATSKKSLDAVQAAFSAWHAESGRPLAHISRVLALGVGS